ncbi:MAG: rRNA pseudouridine synthase, partial [Clostridia bacterium]|nr:rRNA pseudouridine synthase [Clostridia bacterium]
SNNKIYIMMYKPRGYVTTVHDELERKCVLDLINNKITERVYPVGRLDKNSEGILLITNDGNFANIIMHPSNKISKTYRVTVNSEITDIQVNNLLLIKEIDGQKINPPEIKILESSINRSVLEIKISQGLNRQIRKMCELVNLEVTRLKRISIGNLKLGNLKPGTFRNLEQHEINYFLDK